MADGARKVLNADVAVSVTGLAGPGGDEFGNPVGTVYIGYSDGNTSLARHFLFDGDRSQVRSQAAAAALKLILEFQI
jgi:nicotinamide-nucleotide amidase